MRSTLFVEARDSSATSSITLSTGLLDNPESMDSFLVAKARTLGLTPHSRTISKGHTQGAGFIEGRFTHGTVPLQPIKSDSAVTSGSQIRSKYGLLSIYLLDDKSTVYIMEAWTTKLPEGVENLYKAQRSWKNKK